MNASKIHVPTTDVVREGTGAESKAGMEMNAKAYRILTTVIYQDKIGSVVREICCNAYDSHVEAGKGQVPFVLHMPNEDEPYFSVRDMGIGLDEEGVRVTFSRYFHSTKESNHAVIGAFGLGSKTPLAYTDTYSIIATKDGVRRHFTSFFDSEGIPTVVLMSEEETSDENGVEVQVPVINEKDFSRFRNAVREQLRFFTVKPELVNFDDEIEWPNVTVDDADTMFKLEGITVGNGRHGTLRGLWALQGVVGYKMDLTILTQHLSEENVTFLNLISESAIIHFDIGQLEVTASREGISYTPETIRGITARLNAAREAMATVVRQKIDAIESPWAKALELNRNQMLRRMLNACGYKMEHNHYYRTQAGVFADLMRIANIDNHTAQEDGEVKLYDGEKTSDGKLASALKLTFESYQSKHVRGQARWANNGLSKAVLVSDDIKIIVRDTSDKPVVRMREFTYGLHSRDKVLYLSNRDGSNVTQAQVDAIIERAGAGFGNFIMLSSIDPPSPEAREGRKGYKPPTAYSYDKGDDISTAREWERESCALADWEEGAYYCTVDRHSLSMSQRCRVVTAMFDAGLLDRPIVAIRQRDVEKIKDNPLWVNIEDKAKEIIAGIAENRSIMHAHVLSSVNPLNSIEAVNNLLRKPLQAAIADGRIRADGVIAKAFRLQDIIERLKARSQRSGYSTLSHIAMSHLSSTQLAEVARIRDLIEKQVEAVQKDIRDTIPFIAHARTNWVYNAKTGRSESVMADETIEHVIRYVETFDTGAASSPQLTVNP